MGKPIWDAGGVGIALADVAYSVQPGTPAGRMLLHATPGVDGTNVGFLGQGPRIWRGRGILQTSAVASEAAAAQDVKDALIARQSVVANEIKSYTDTTTDVYTYCVLIAFDAAGPITTHPSGVNYTGQCPVTFAIMQLDPSA